MKKLILSVLSMLLIFGMFGCSKNEEVNTDNIEGDTIIIGEIGLGFVEVMASWLKFQDLNPKATGYQYASPDGLYIVTLDKVTWPSNTLEENNTSEIAASNIWNYLDKSNFTNIKGAKIKYKLIEVDVYQVYGNFNDGKSMLIIDSFMDKNNVVHTVSIEGPTTQELLDYYKLITESYIFEK